MDRTYELICDLVDLVEETDLAARELRELPYCGDDFNDVTDKVNDAAYSLRFSLEAFLGKKLESILVEDINLALGQ